MEGGLNNYAYAADNPFKFTDPNGLDYWMEGADESESGYGFHQSICAGKPNGRRKCISFGRIPGQGDCWFNCKGHIYYDRSPAGPPVTNKYRYTDSKTDKKIRIYFDSLVGDKGRYDILFGKNCRNFSEDLFEDLVKKYGGMRGTPPNQMPPKI